MIQKNSPEIYSFDSNILDLKDVSSLIPVTIRHIGKNVFIYPEKTNFYVRKGILRFFGDVQFAQGKFCGIELNKSIGKNNGSIQGIRYFQCTPNHGIFVPSEKVYLYYSGSQGVDVPRNENVTTLKKNLSFRKSNSEFDSSLKKNKPSEIKISSDSNVWDAINLCSARINDTVSNSSINSLDHISQVDINSKIPPSPNNILRSNVDISLTSASNLISNKFKSNLQLGSPLGYSDSNIIEDLIDERMRLKNTYVRGTTSVDKNNDLLNCDICISSNCANPPSNFNETNNVIDFELNNMNSIDRSLESQVKMLSQTVIPSFTLVDKLVAIQYFIDSNQKNKETICIRNIMQLLNKDLSAWQVSYNFHLSQYHQIKVDIDTHCYEYLEALSNTPLGVLQI